MAKKIYTKKRSYKKKTVKKARKTVKSPLRKIIQREISRNIENKTVEELTLSTLIVGSGSAATFDSLVQPLGFTSDSLSLSQGVGQGQRIGNQIKVKSLRLKGTIWANPYNVATNPQPIPSHIKIWIFYDKENPTTVPTPAVNANFFQFGNSTSGFQNNLVDLWAPVNKDRYKVFATKIVKVGFASNTGTGALPTYGYLANNDFKYNANFSFDLAKYYPKIVKFNDNNIDCTTRGLSMMMEAVAANGAAISAGLVPCSYSMMQTCEFEDA